VRRRIIIERGDDFIGHLRQQARDSEAVLASFKPLLRDHSAPKQCAMQKVAHRAARVFTLGGVGRAQLRTQP
jgi:hypothetical protein